MATSKPAKRYTMEDGKTRAAGRGPWVSADDCRNFLGWLTAQGISWREHTGLGSRGYQVRHDGHWMGLLWNKGFRRYTADRRLENIVRRFVESKAAAG
jgi:hypothetical protein